MGKQCVELDVNSMKPLDNLCHPISVIKEAEELAAEAFGASHAFLMVGGTTSFCTESTLTIASNAPAAPSRWPVIDFVLLMLSS